MRSTGRPTRSTVRGLAAATVAVTLASCGTASTPVAEDAVDTPAGQRWTSCAVEAPEVGRKGAVDGGDAGLALPRLPDDFTAVAGIVCARQAQRRADGGEDLVATESRADDVAALVAALRLPDEQPPGGPCTSEMPLLPWLALLDDQGSWVRPKLPRDRCGKMRAEVRAAVDELRLTRVATVVLDQIESAEAAAAGCAQQWADSIAVETGSASRARATSGPVPLPAAGQIRRCVYRVPPEERGSGKPAGEFDHGGVLTPKHRTAIAKALLAATRPQSCSTPAGRFALLRAVDGGGGLVYVELDGCRRIMVAPLTGAPLLAQGDDDLAALLDR